jgi:hypothetical protein
MQEGKPLFRYKLWGKGSILQTNDAEFYNSEQLFLLLCPFFACDFLQKIAMAGHQPLISMRGGKTKLSRKYISIFFF